MESALVLFFALKLFERKDHTQSISTAQLNSEKRFKKRAGTSSLVQTVKANPSHTISF